MKGINDDIQNKQILTESKFSKKDVVQEIKRKDPKSMSIEELEEYLKNKCKNLRKDDDNKSLNSSFNSQKQVHNSCMETNKIFNKLTENKFEKKNFEKSPNNNDACNNSKIIKPIFSNEILNSIALKNPFLQQMEEPTLQTNSQIKKTSNILGELYSPRDKENINNMSNISFEQNYSDNEETRRYKFNPKNLISSTSTAKNENSCKYCC